MLVWRRPVRMAYLMALALVVGLLQVPMTSGFSESAAHADEVKPSATQEAVTEEEAVAAAK